MENRPLGRRGPALPVIGLGTWRVFDVEGPKAEENARLVVHAALRAGTRVFDTSPMYGRAERVLALALGEHRPSAFVATKVWARNAAEARLQIDQALEWYGGRVNLYQVHNLSAIDEVLPMLEELRDTGRVDRIGATDYRDASFPALAQWMRSGRLDAVQVPYNPARPSAADRLLPLADELGIGVLAMSPFQSGALVSRTPPPEVAAGLRDAGVVSWPEAILRWIASDPRVTVTLPATSRPGRPAENARAGGPPWLETRLREAMTRALR